MANTPNLNLEEPAHGSANWDTPLNSNFSKIDAGVLLNAPLADQTITGGFDLTNNQGSFKAINGAVSLNISVDGGGQARLDYTDGSISSALLFNPTTGAVVLNPLATGADDNGHGVVINNSGLSIAGKYSDGVSALMAGNVIIQGAGSSSNVLTLGFTGVEGIILTNPPSGSGSYKVRSPASSVDSVLSLPIGTGTLALEVTAPSTATSAGVAGSIAYDASFIYVCVSTNVWRRAAIAAW